MLFFTASIFTAGISEFSLKKLNGDEFNISDHIGSKIILIDFWATWCKPCKKLLKKLNDISVRLNDKVLVLAVSTDDSSSFSRIENYIRSKKYKFTVLLDPDGKVSELYNPSSKIPFTMIVDKKGEIRYTHTGYIPGLGKDLSKRIITLSNEK